MATTSARGRLALSISAGIFVFVGLLWGRSVFVHRPPGALSSSIGTKELLADGHRIVTIRIDSHAAGATGPPKIEPLEGAHRFKLQEIEQTGTGWAARLRVGVNPGRIALRIEVPGLTPTTAEFSTTLQTSDSIGDGTPDFLRLDGQNDQETFRRWFTFLAEAQYYQEPGARPAGINDCAALIRYAYREALRQHDSQWASSARLPLIPALDSVAKYEYPHTPVGPAAFRVRDGAFQPSDLQSGAFSEFADAQTLRRFNTYLITRDISRARSGDLIFFRQESDHMPFHGMIFLGKSQFDQGPTRYFLYHTGPSDGDPGEIRRLTTDELLHFPDPRWRPIQANPAFLGVFRWNILKQEL